jgi:hypothetical protein
VQRYAIQAADAAPTPPRRWRTTAGAGCGRRQGRPGSIRRAKTFVISMRIIPAAPAPAEGPPPQLPPPEAEAREERPTVASGDSGATRIGGDADLWKDGGRGDAKISDGDDADWRRTRPRPRRRQRSPLIVATARWQTEAGRHRNSPARIQNQRVKQIWFIPPLRSTKGDGPNNALHRAVVIERHDACDSTSTT